MVSCAFQLAFQEVKMWGMQIGREPILIRKTLTSLVLISFQYEYALRQLYVLVNVCELGYPTDR